MFRRLVYFCGVPFLILALYCSLMELGFLDLSKLDSYKSSSLTSISEQLSYLSRVWRSTYQDFDKSAFNSFMSDWASRSGDGTLAQSVLVGVQSLVNSTIHLGSTILIGGALMVDFVNSIVSMLNMFVDLAYGNISGGLWSNTWDWFESYPLPYTDLSCLP